MGVKNIFSFFVLLFSLFLCGQTIEENEILYDSIVSHEVQKKETLFSISKIYGISVEDLLKVNPDLKTDKLKRKSILNIPLKKVVKINAINDINEELDSVLVISEKDNSLFSKKFKRKNLNIALLAPLKLNSIVLDSVELTKKTLSELNLTTISINFLNGLKSTIKELEERGVKIDLSIYDTENNINKIKELKAQDFSSYDLVIGPFINRNFNEFAHEDSSRTFDGFNDLSELAIGNGVGLRYDSGLFIFRLDMGLKTHNPSLEKGKRWLTDFSLKKAVFNIGLNYPF